MKKIPLGAETDAPELLLPVEWDEEQNIPNKE